MTTSKCQHGDIVLVEFVFTQGGGSKKRPAYVLSCLDYHKSRNEVILAAITSNTSVLRVGDTKIKDWKAAGLLFPSLVSGIIQTVKRSIVIKKIGRLSARDATNVETNLRLALALNGE